MGSLLTTILKSTSALRAFDQTLNVIENNVTNASTPGYVKQTQTLQSLPFDPETGASGGVVAGPILSARSEYAEESVRSRQQLLGQYEQKAADLAQIEPLFDLTGDSGVPGALSKFFQSFSQLSINPNDTVARQSVIDRAGAVAQSFNQSANGMATAAGNVDRQTRDVVSGINRLVSQIRDINVTRRNDYRATNDPGIDAQLHNDLEELAELADFTAIQQTDGTVSLYLGGQTPLLLGDQQYAISADLSASQTRILNAQNEDVSAQIHGGRLAALLDEKNNLIPSYMGDLNQLAQTFSEQVNAGLAAGVDKNGDTPPVELFRCDPTAGAAATLAVTQIQPDDIAAASPAAPGGNGNALTMAAMGDVKLVNGFSFTEFYGDLGGRIGRDLSTAQQNQTSQQQLVVQARNLRAETSSVSLDEEAAHLIQVQRSYQAAAKIITALDELTQTVINLLT